MDKIISLLEKAGVSAWRVTRKRTEAVELYFIKKKLDLPRYRILMRSARRSSAILRRTG